MLQCTVLSDLSESSQKLGSLEWSMQQEVANAEEKKAEVMRGRYDLQTKLSVMMNLTGKFKTEETKSINHLQASFKEMAHLEEESVYV